MTGKILAALTVICAVLAGFFTWYTNTYAYYREIDLKSAEAVLTLVPLDGSAAQELVAVELRAIDSDSSPIRFRACFRLTIPVDELVATYQPFAAPAPNFAPPWFDCFDAMAIGKALEAGEAKAFLSVPLIHPQVDRVIAVFPDGRAYAWQQPRPEETPTLE